MTRIALPLLALSLALLACTLTNEMRATVQAGDTSTPSPKRTAPRNTQTATPPPAFSPTSPASCIVTADALTLRAGPGVDFHALDFLTRGDALTILDEDAAGW